MLNVKVELDAVRIQLAANAELISRCKKLIDNALTRMNLYNCLEYDEAYLPILKKNKLRLLRLIEIDEKLLLHYDQLKRLETR